MRDEERALLVHGPQIRNGLEEEEHKCVCKGGNGEKIQFSSPSIKRLKAKVKPRKNHWEAAEPEEGGWREGEKKKSTKNEE